MVWWKQNDVDVDEVEEDVEEWNILMRNIQRKR